MNRIELVMFSFYIISHYLHHIYGVKQQVVDALRLTDLFIYLFIHLFTYLFIYLYYLWCRLICSIEVLLNIKIFIEICISMLQTINPKHNKILHTSLQ